jgi:hypothetical protein
MIGVLGQGTIYTLSDDKRIHQIALGRQPAHIGELCELAGANRLSQIWIMPGIECSHEPPAFPGYETFIKWSSYEDDRPAPGARPTFARVGRDASLGQPKGTTFIGFPPYEDEWGWTIDRPETLLGTLYYLQQALAGAPIMWGPGYIAAKLTTSCNAGKRKDWLGSPDIALDEHMPFKRAARDLIWKSPELPSGKHLWLHYYDKNSAYLAACTGVYLGTGNPVYKGPDPMDLDWSLPGIYRVTWKYGDSRFDGKQLPPCINTDWITTDVLQIATALGYQIHVHEAWQWPEKHRILGTWGAALWNARALLHPEYGDAIRYPNKDCRANAYATIKRIALIGVGRFASPKASHFLRPDWWALIVGRARATLLRKIDHIYRVHGLSPVLIYNDGIFYCTGDPDPETAIPGLTERWDKLGGYKHEYTLPVTPEMRELFSKRSPGQLIEYLNDQADYQDQEAE